WGGPASTRSRPPPITTEPCPRPSGHGAGRPISCRRPARPCGARRSPRSRRPGWRSTASIPLCPIGCGAWRPRGPTGRCSPPKAGSSPPVSLPPPVSPPGASTAMSRAASPRCCF
ncbi:MAG: hypothetical protein ACK55Z_35080, partial [bacterium]